MNTITYAWIRFLQKLLSKLVAITRLMKSSGGLTFSWRALSVCLSSRKRDFLRIVYFCHTWLNTSSEGGNPHGGSGSAYRRVVLASSGGGDRDFLPTVYVLLYLDENVITRGTPMVGLVVRIGGCFWQVPVAANVISCRPFTFAILG